MAEVSYRRLAELQAVRAEQLGWQPRPAPTVAATPVRTWWRVPTLRSRAFGEIRRVLIVLLVPVVATLFGARAWLTTIVLATDDTRVVEATVVELPKAREDAIFASKATVLFADGDDERRATILLRNHPSIGDTLSVRYSTARPAWAKPADGRDGTTQLTLISGSAAVLGLGFVVGRIALTVRRQRRIHALSRTEERECWFVCFVDWHGTPGLALFDSADSRAPSAIVPLLGDAPTLNAVPTAGKATVHGDPRGSGYVVPVVAGWPLWPMGPPLALPAGAVETLVMGNEIPPAARGVWPTRRLRDLLPRL